MLQVVLAVISDSSSGVVIENTLEPARAIQTLTIVNVKSGGLVGLVYCGGTLVWWWGRPVGTWQVK